MAYKIILDYFLAMLEDQLLALLAKVKDNVVLEDKLNCAADLDAVVALAKQAGFDVSKADWLMYQAQQTLELSNEELEGVAGGRLATPSIRKKARKKEWGF